MKSIWDAEARRELHDRVASLTRDRRTEWGRFTAPKMVCHLADSLKMAMGSLSVAAKRSPIRYAPVKSENYSKADIVAGRVGKEQTAPRREFD